MIFEIPIRMYLSARFFITAALAVLANRRNRASRLFFVWISSDELAHLRQDGILKKQNWPSSCRHSQKGAYVWMARHLAVNEIGGTPCPPVWIWPLGTRILSQVACRILSRRQFTNTIGMPQDVLVLVKKTQNEVVYSDFYLWSLALITSEEQFCSDGNLRSFRKDDYPDIDNIVVPQDDVSLYRCRELQAITACLRGTDFLVGVDYTNRVVLSVVCKTDSEQSGGLESS